MSIKNNKLILYYKPEVKKDKNTFTLARQVSNHILDIDIQKSPLTETQIFSILQNLDLKAEELVEKESEVFKTNFSHVVLDETNWVKALANHPEMMRTPIAIKGEKAILIKTPSNILQLDN
jgi:arsenate reductase (glutaredoxin)